MILGLANGQTSRTIAITIKGDTKVEGDETFAIDLFSRERFNLVIGGVFLAIVLFSPDGLLGLWARLSARFAGPGRSAVRSNPRPSSRT